MLDVFIYKTKNEEKKRIRKKTKYDLKRQLNGRKLENGKSKRTRESERKSEKLRDLIKVHYKLTEKAEKAERRERKREKINRAKRKS